MLLMEKLAEPEEQLEEIPMEDDCITEETSDSIINPESQLNFGSSQPSAGSLPSKLFISVTDGVSTALHVSVTDVEALAMNGETLAFGFDSPSEIASDELLHCTTSHPHQQQNGAINALQIERRKAIAIRASSFGAELQCPKVIQERRRSLERLLGLLYEDGKRRYSTESDFTTDTSHFSDYSQQAIRKFSADYLWRMDFTNLKKLLVEMEEEVIYANNKLIKASKQRAHQITRQQAKCNIITAVLQAMSEKREVDARLQFSLNPPSSENGFQEWTNAMKAVARLPDGIPHHFRQKVWTTLANHYIREIGIDWYETCRIAFNDKVNPDDDRLSLQIIKDLHRTGWSGLRGDDGMLHLKRVLLGYARFNKVIGYCQGFNVIAALVLEVMDYREEITLKVMIFLIEHVLPRGYFDRSLHALSVDMAVLKDLLYQRLPKTSKHLDDLQNLSPSEFEPPLTNVFSMQWFLTLFATCLPKSCLYRVWDALMLEGSEVLLRTSLVIWAKFSSKILKMTTADEFYSVMGSSLCRSIMQMRGSEINDFIGIMYGMSIFPYPGVAELRERYTFNIQPFTPSYSLFQHQVNNILHMSEDEETEADSTSCIGCNAELKATKADLAALQKQYKLLKQRQKQAAVIWQSVCERNLIQQLENGGSGGGIADPNQPMPIFNHLFLSAVLAHYPRNNGESPLYVTLCGTVPVASQVVQPFNEDSMKAQITLSKDGPCFMLTSNQQDVVDYTGQNINGHYDNKRHETTKNVTEIMDCIASEQENGDNCNTETYCLFNCSNENVKNEPAHYLSRQETWNTNCAQSVSTANAGCCNKHIVINIEDEDEEEEEEQEEDCITHTYAISDVSVTKKATELHPHLKMHQRDKASRAALKRSHSLIGNIARQGPRVNLPSNPFPTVHKSTLFRDSHHSTL